MQVNGLKLVDAYLGGAEKLPGFFASYGARNVPTTWQIRKWRQRGVPDGWIVDLLAYLEIEHGGPVSLAPFLGGD